MTAFTPWDDTAIRTTLARYCHHCDDGNLTDAAALFTPDTRRSLRYI